MAPLSASGTGMTPNDGRGPASGNGMRLSAGSFLPFPGVRSGQRLEPARGSIRPCRRKGRLSIARPLSWLSAILVLLAGAVPLTSAQGDVLPRRIVSINACTDQLLLALADREQIAALTNYAADPEYSIYADEVKRSGIRLIAGNAEQVLKLNPDLVVAGTFTKRATRELLESHGVKIKLFDPPLSIAGNSKSILEAARLFGHPERGEALVAEIDKSLAGAQVAIDGNLSVLQFQRRAYTSGSATLLGDLLHKLGAKNAADSLGISQSGKVTLELILKVRPDALIVFDPNQRPEDQGSSLFSHPALNAVLPRERRIALPNNQIVCGSSALPLAVATLRKGLQGLHARSSSTPQ